MLFVIESCNMNKLSPECYIKELVSRLTAKPVCTAEKSSTFVLLYPQINIKSNYFLFLTN